MSLNENIVKNGFPSSQSQQKEYQENLDYGYSLAKLRELLKTPCTVLHM